MYVRTSPTQRTYSVACVGGQGVEGWQSLRDKYGGLVKPDIVFFGENLPPRFHNLLKEDFQSCDLLIVMGTSLAVQVSVTTYNRPADSFFVQTSQRVVL